MHIAVALTLLLFAVRPGSRAWRTSYAIRPGAYWIAAAAVTEATLTVWCVTAAWWLMR